MATLLRKKSSQRPSKWSNPTLSRSLKLQI
jgi:hypothetical protein